MDSIDDQRSEIIELAVATEATCGAWGIYTDEVLMRSMHGLDDD